MITEIAIHYLLVIDVQTAINRCVKKPLPCDRKEKKVNHIHSYTYTYLCIALLHLYHLILIKIMSP